MIGDRTGPSVCALGLFKPTAAPGGSVRTLWQEAGRVRTCSGVLRISDSGGQERSLAAVLIAWHAVGPRHLCARANETTTFSRAEKKKHDEEMYLNIRFFSQPEGIIYIFQH